MQRVSIADAESFDIPQQNMSRALQSICYHRQKGGDANVTPVVPFLSDFRHVRDGILGGIVAIVHQHCENDHS